MPNLLPHSRLVQDTIFQGRVRAATVQAAILVSGEAGDVEPTPRQVLRGTFAGKVIDNEVSWEAVTWATASNPTVLSEYVASIGGEPTDGDQGQIPDSDLEFVLSSIWDDLSGAARIAP